MRFTWAELLAHWRLIEADLHSEYGIDVATGILSRRTGAWLRTRISGLLTRKSRLLSAVRPDEKRS